MALSDYIASRYLNADRSSSETSKKSKRRKIKHTPGPTSSIVIADDDNATIPAAFTKSDDEDAPTIVNGAASGVIAKSQKKKAAKWKRIGGPTPSFKNQAVADAVIAEVEAERRQQEADEDEAPAIAMNEDEEQGDVLMASGAKAGLQSAKQVTVDLKRRAEAERRRMELADDYGGSRGSETIYRDASGRVVNVAMVRAEARAKADEKKRKEEQMREALRGDVQKREQDQRRQQLEEMKTSRVARGAEDERMNAELKRVERWNDPMKGLLSARRGGGGDSGGVDDRKGERAAMVKSKRTYRGPSEPNRYGILPGHRWDGVDRGNGFERKWFTARNEKESKKALSYAWEIDD